MIGIDIVDIAKFKEKASKDYFLNKAFTADELGYAKKRENELMTLAGLYAAKEAAIKAYGLKLTYILRGRVEIKHLDKAPLLYIDKQKAQAELSISHDGDYAVSVCRRDEEINKVDKEMKDLYPKRDKNSHKGDYGRIGILGGSVGMAGSVYMASLSSMRAGAGLSYIIAPSSIIDILQIKAIEQIILPIKCDNFAYEDMIIAEILEAIKDKDVIAIGPGMGKAEDLDKLIGKILASTDKTFVIDADGLNAISHDLSILEVSNDITLTPHLKEFSRLTGLSIDEIKADRQTIAKDFAKKHGVILVLKSEETLVTDGINLYINKIGNPGMATAGSGDVLTGIIAALNKRLDPFKAAKLGVYIHSLAGDLAAADLTEDSLMATDIINYIPKAIKLLR